MTARRIRSLVLSSLCLVFAATASAEVTENKRLLIRELFQLVGGGRTSEHMVQIMLAQYQQMYGAMIDQLVSEAEDLTPEDEEAVRELLGNFDWFAIQFSARFAERIDIEAVQDAVYTPLYDKYFDERELTELVSFYRTPTGRKSIEVMPAILQEGMAATFPLIQPKVMALVSEIMMERLAELR